MNREFEVTEGMVEWAMNGYQQKAGESEVSSKRMRDALLVALAHPDFRAQLRAWAAEEMRGLVSRFILMAEANDLGLSLEWMRGHNACRAETIANIERWGQSHD